MVPKCDVCGVIAQRNAAAHPVTSTKDRLTVQIKVLKSNGKDCIVCERCVKVAAYHGVRT
jgi:hypothetical protein